ncbi:MAG: D-aminoacyl-tRNA deacylase [Brevinema sp.]
MVILVRRVSSASVTVEDRIVSFIGQGLLLYVGVSVGDTQKECDYFAKKVSNLRIFESQEKEISVKNLSGEILSVSQFTLSAETKKGNRPTYSKAMPSSEAEYVFGYFNQRLEEESALEVQTGVFGADMKISAIDDGPFTIILQ